MATSAPARPRWFFVLVALALGGTIVWASIAGGPLFAAVGRVVAEPWGVVMLADLYAGFVAASALFLLFERRPVALALIVSLMVLGNVVTLAWLALRGWTLLQRAGRN